MHCDRRNEDLLSTLIQRLEECIWNAREVIIIRGGGKHRSKIANNYTGGAGDRQTHSRLSFDHNQNILFLKNVNKL